MTNEDVQKQLSTTARVWLTEQQLYEPKPYDLQPLDAEGIKRFEERYAHIPRVELTPEQKAVVEESERRMRDGTGRYLTHEEVMRMHSLRRLLAKVHDEAIYRAESPRTKVQRWRPSIFMRPQHSRITLAVTKVRCERLHAITREDAIAEGPPMVQQRRVNGKPATVHYFDPVAAYGHLWCDINGVTGPTSWKANPFVWVVEFARIKP